MQNASNNSKSFIGGCEDQKKELKAQGAGCRLVHSEPTVFACCDVHESKGPSLIPGFADTSTEQLSYLQMGCGYLFPTSLQQGFKDRF